MIFGKHINRYYIRFLPLILVGLAALIMVDWMQLLIPGLYELVINGMVYDLLETGLVEPPHELCAYLDGHEIAAGTGADSYAFIRFDGEVLKRKLRLT